MEFNFIDTIKKIALEIMTERAPQVLFGVVTSKSPLTITVEDRLKLTEEFIVLNTTVEEGENVVIMKYADGNKYLVLKIIKTVYSTPVYNGGIVELDTPAVMADTWITCNASAYGDKEIGNHMANGEKLTETSMTVAVPMGEYYKKHKNKRMMISYNGKVVTVKVTDCGNFGEGNKYTNRQLDLAPGVWKAFGFTDPKVWGIREVKYKYVD